MVEKVSVIIPTYNYGHYITNAIDSVLKQDYPNVEIIVVDDGSTDNTKKILQPYNNKIKYIFQKNAGLSAARNKGIELCSGDFIQFLDSDDILSANVISAQINFLKSNPWIDIAVCQNRTFRKLNKSKKIISYNEWPLYKKSIDSHLCFLNIAPPHAYFFKKNIFNTIDNWFDPELKACEDYDMWFRLLINNHIPHHNPKGLVYYRKHKKSMSSNRKKQLLYDAILHKKNSILLNSSHNIELNKRIEYVLALCAGTLRTYTMLEKHNITDTIGLPQLIITNIDEITRIIKNKNDISILSFLFLCRFEKLLESNKINIKILEDCFNKQINRFYNKKIKIYFFASFVLQLIYSQTLCVYAKKEMLYYLINFIKQTIQLVYRNLLPSKNKKSL